MGRVLGVDLGSKRIGIAVSDAGRSLASPLTIVARSGDRFHDHVEIARLVKDEEAELVVVGLPIDLSGKAAVAATHAAAEAGELATVVSVPVETYDERMTSAAAHKQLQAHGLNARQRREKVDKFAAAIILQGWLDSKRRARQ